MSFGDASGLKKFVTQDEVDEKRKKRQEEWEKVRKPDDPEECPEEPVDNRSLYDKLEEQRLKKEEEYEEKVAFRNQVRRLDEDEADFLDFVTETQQEVNKARNQEEAQLISELKSAQVVKVAEQKTEEKRSKPVPTQQTNKKSQMALLAGAVKRKGSEDSSQTKKSRLSTESETAVKNAKSDGDQRSEDKSSSTQPAHGTSSSTKSVTTGRVARVVGIRPAVLPGLTYYEDSSDSMSSSSDSEVDFPLQGRTMCVYVKQNVQQQ